MAEKKEIPPEVQVSIEPVKPVAKKPVKVAKQKKKADGISLPLLIEFIFTFSAIILIFVFLSMSFVSWLTGATLFDFVLRTSVSMLVQGSLLLLVSRQVSVGVLNVSEAEVEEEKKRLSVEETESSENIEKYDSAEAQ